MSHPLHLVVSVDDQKLKAYQGNQCIREFAVSTSAWGLGFENGSFKTPTGRFRICERVGDGEPIGTIFKSRVPVGLWHQGEASSEDLVLTRILRLDGLDPGNANTLSRYIYIHGTNREDLIGQPASHGCVRLGNVEMVELFDMVSEGDAVEILPATIRMKRYKKETPPVAGLREFVLAGPDSSHSLISVMSTKVKKAATTGVRYSDAQKKEIVDYVIQYNSSKGRGGQSAASKKFKVTPLTISAWIKASGNKAKAAPKAAAKPVKAPKSASQSKKGVRYTAEQKQEVVDFVTAYNANNGRGGQSQAAKKFSLSVLTVSSWLKSAGKKGGKGVVKAVKAAKATSASPSALTSKIASLIEVGDQLRKAESETEKLRAKYDALRASIQALI